MLTIHELLEDPVYKQWVFREPHITPPVQKLYPESRVWRVYAQVKVDGRWAQRSFKSFKKAAAYFQRILPLIYDGALCCVNNDYAPPLVRLRDGTRQLWRRFPPDHAWCGYCRRPTTRAYFATHHAFGSRLPTRNRRRCVICGCSESFARDWYARAFW